jgi:hypothetical protein
MRQWTGNAVKGVGIPENLFRLTDFRTKSIIQPYSPMGEDKKKGGALPDDADDRIKSNRQSQPWSTMKARISVELHKP